jgi:hypothetical protein
MCKFNLFIVATLKSYSYIVSMSHFTLAEILIRSVNLHPFSVSMENGLEFSSDNWSLNEILSPLTGLYTTFQLDQPSLHSELWLW